MDADTDWRTFSWVCIHWVIRSYNLVMINKLFFMLHDRVRRFVQRVVCQFGKMRVIEIL